MSETDDTDDLLLIPPDFFLVPSEPDPPYYGIVDNLIKQVSNLQNRIETIEASSDVSLVESFLDHSFDSPRKTVMYTLPKSASQRRSLSQDDLYQSTSTHNTPHKTLVKHRLSSLPNSPNVNRFSTKNVKFSPPQRHSLGPSIRSSASKQFTKNSELNESRLSETDSFLINTNTTRRNQTVRNLQNEFESINRNKPPAAVTSRSAFSHNNMQYRNQDVQKTIDELDRQSQRLIEESKSQELRKPEKETDLSKESKVDRQSTWRCGDNVESIPNYGTGIRDIFYNHKNIDESSIKPTKTNPNFHQTTSSTTEFTSTNTTLDKSTDSSSDSTQITAYNNFKINEELNKINQKYHNKAQTDHNSFQLYDSCKSSHKTDGLYNVSEESNDIYKIDQERNELLHSPLHDNALSVLNMHQKLLENSKDSRNPKKRGINTLSDTLGLLSLADIWGAAQLSQSPSKLTQKLQEEKLRRQHCEQLIQELQNKILELQQKLAVAVKVDETKNNTIQSFKDALEKASLKLDKLNAERSNWDLEMTRIRNQFTVELESASQKVVFYEKEASKALNLAHTNQEKMSTLEKKCSNLQSELEGVEIKLKEVEENYRNELEKNKHLTDIVSHKEIELKENKIVLNNAREEVSQSRKAVEVCQSEFTSLKSECAKLQSELREERNTVLNLTEQKRKLHNDLQTYKSNEKTLKESLENTKAKLESTKVELRNFYQGQLELIVENKRKELQSQLDRERQNNLEELKKREFSMARTAANHIKEISDKCALETKLLEQKHQEEIRLYHIQLSQYKKEIDALHSKLAHLPEKRAQVTKQLQKVIESQLNEALKIMSGSPTSFTMDNQVIVDKNAGLPKSYFNADQKRKEISNFESVSDFDETPVSSRGVKPAESEIQKYINMLLNRQPGNPTNEAQDVKKAENSNTASWVQGDKESQNKQDITAKTSSKDKRSEKPPWK